MDRGSLRKLAVALVAAALVAESGVLVWQWRSAASSRAQARRAERQAAEAQRRLDESQGQAGQGGQAGNGSGDLLGQLGSLLGNGGGGLDALGGLLGGGGDAAACTEALAGAAQGGGGLFGGGGQEPSGNLRAQVRSIAATVQHLRGLRFEHPPAPRFLSSSALASRVAASVAKDYPRAQADADGRALVALGALPAGSDLKKLQAKALSGAVAGFYDPDTGELVVGSGGGKLSASARVALSHELEHALADQNLHLPAAAEHPRQGQADANLGALGLVEGDATLTMQQYSLAKLGLQDQLSMLSEALPAQGQLDRLPPYLSQRLTFPYLQGMSFVCRLYASGGWKGVDRAYARPPTTSAQVLFPDRYQADEQAVDARDAPAPAAPWRLLGRETFGAADLLWQFQAPGGHKDRALDRPLDRAAAWAGGELATYADGARTGVSLALAQRRGSSGLCQSLQAWYQAAFPGSREQPAAAGEAMARQGPTGYAVLRCPGSEARLGIAPDAATARTLAS